MSHCYECGALLPMHQTWCKQLGQQLTTPVGDPMAQQYTAALRKIAELEADNAALLTKVRQCLTMTRSEAQLLAGEMTAGEWRTVSAILANRIKVIDAMREGKKE